MASYDIPYQNISYNVPDNGVYVDPTAVGGRLVINSGGTLYTPYIQDIGQRYAATLGADAEKAASNSGSAAMMYGHQYLDSLGIDMSKLPHYSGNMADLIGGVPKEALARGSLPTDLNALSALLKTPSSPYKSFTQTISPSNPNGIDIRDSTGASLYSSPSAEANLTKAGASPAQAAALAAAERSAAPGAGVPNSVLSANGIPNSTTPPSQVPVTPTIPNKIDSNAPGSNATNLYDYYASQGKPLPAVADRATVFQQLGLGESKDYKGTAQQNEELLSAMQRKDYAGTTLGASNVGNFNTGTNTSSMNQTPSGMALASALTGGTASDTLNNYKTYLASALGIASGKLATDESNLASFFSTQKDASTILQEAMDARGITQEQTLLAALDKQISAQTTILDNLPKDIQTTLQDVGVSQAQLDRLVNKESQKPTALLKDLLTQRNALSTEIDKAMSFAEKFANTQIAAQAARLSALEWMVTSDKGDYNNLDGDMKTVITETIAQQKEVMTTALKAAENGASGATIKAILAAQSPGDAILAAGSSLVTKKNTSASTQMTAGLNQMGGAFEAGGSGYNGRGPDGFVDPYLYVQGYTYMKSNFGDAGIKAFFTKYPPGKNVNPEAVSLGILPPEIVNAIQAASSKKSSTIK